MDTLLTKTFELTENQIDNLMELKPAPFIAMTYNRNTGQVLATSLTQPSGPDITSLQNAIDALPDTPNANVTASRFSAEILRKSLWTRFMLGQFSFGMRNEQANLCGFAEIVPRNFVGMKQYLAALQSNNVATQTDVDNVKAAILEQGINLDNF